MKVSEECRITASKGSQVLGSIRRNITYKETSLIVPLYKALRILCTDMESISLSNCHLWLQVVVNMRPRPHPGNGFDEPAKPGEGIVIGHSTYGERGLVYPSM